MPESTHEPPGAIAHDDLDASLIEIVSGAAGAEAEVVRIAAGEVEVSIRAEELLHTLRALRDYSAAPFGLLADVTVVDRRSPRGRKKARFELSVRLIAPSTGQRVRLRCVATPGEGDAPPRIPSLTKLWPGAGWLEREVWDLFGVAFDNHPDLRRLLLPSDFVGHPLRRDFSPDRLDGKDGGAEAASKGGQTSDSLPAGRRVSIGPDHPITRGGLRLVVELDGEEIDALGCEVGYGHRGLEKAFEGVAWEDGAAFAERLGAHASVPASLAWCLAIESLIRVDLPERAQWLRVLAAELSRVADHLGRLARLDAQLGADAAAGLARAAQELIFDVFEAVCGARGNPGYVVVGGVAREPSEDFATRWWSRRPKLESLLAEHAALTLKNRIHWDRLEGVATLSREEAIAHGLTGPLLRAAGEAFDVRTSVPYLVYPQIGFDLPIGSVGDDLDRVLVCREEIRQSLTIADLCLEVLENLGPGRSRVAEDALPRDASGGLAVREGEAFAAVEAANGMLGCFVVSKGEGTPYRVHWRVPDLASLQALPLMLRGRQLADIGPTLALTNAIDAGFDR